MDRELRDTLGRARRPTPPRGLSDSVMRQVAVRPRPRRRSWWTAFTARRELTLGFRWSSVCTALSAAAIALAAGVHARRSTPPPVAPPASAQATAPRPVEPVLVRFSLQAPGAHTVQLAGDFNGWRLDATQLDPGSGGVWTATVPLASGSWSYAFVVDGKFVEDPAAGAWRDDGFGGRNAVVRVGG